MRLALTKNNMSKEELSTTPEKINGNSELKTLLEKNLELSEEILTKVKYVKRYIFWKRVIPDNAALFIRFILFLLSDAIIPG